jgi:hypothetical protein
MCACARGNTHASRGILGDIWRLQSGAMAWPMGALGGNGRLVESGGGEWGWVAHQRPMASPRSFRATVGALATSASERGQGEVRAGLSLRPRVRWCCSGGGGLWLGVFGGRGRREKKWGRSPLDLLGLIPSFVSRSYRTRAGAGV